MFTRTTTYNIIDRTYHGGGAKYSIVLFSFFFTLLKAPIGVRVLDTTGCLSHRTPRHVGERRRRSKEARFVRGKNETRVPRGNHRLYVCVCLVVDDLTHCDARRRRGRDNIRTGRYSGCGDGRSRADRLQPIVEGAFETRGVGLFSETPRRETAVIPFLCAGKALAAISGTRRRVVETTTASRRRRRRLATPPRVLARGIRGTASRDARPQS